MKILLNASRRPYVTIMNNRLGFMKRLALWLLPMALSAAQPRYARLGDFEGTVEVQLQAADDWQAARRNLALRESSWLRTEGQSRVEVELDEGSVVRLGPDSLAEFSDYTRLSTGQRVTLISLDHGVAYFTGSADPRDTLMLAVPGAQVSVHEAARLRLEARDPWTLVAAAEGVARFSSPAAEFDLTEGRVVKLDPARPSRFFLNSDLPALPTDRWSDERDKVLRSTSSGSHVPGIEYGLADLDAYGAWVPFEDPRKTGCLAPSNQQSSSLNGGANDAPLCASQDYGLVWKPKVAPGWMPFRNGTWQWYDGLGFTWISADAWGWLPFHYGRWVQQQEGRAWVWAPGESTVFKPGDVYWLKAAKLVGWGPLAPGENWAPPNASLLFESANTTYAAYTPDTHDIDPTGFARPKEPVAAALTAALPSPPFPASRLDAFRPALRAGGLSAVSVSSSAAFDAVAQPAPPAPQQHSYAPAPPPQQTDADAPAPETVEVDVPVPVPVYTGIIMVMPPNYKPPSKTAAKAPAKPAPPVSREPQHKLPEPDKPR